MISELEELFRYQYYSSEGHAEAIVCPADGVSLVAMYKGFDLCWRCSLCDFDMLIGLGMFDLIKQANRMIEARLEQ